MQVGALGRGGEEGWRRAGDRACRRGPRRNQVASGGQRRVQVTCVESGEAGIQTLLEWIIFFENFWSRVGAVAVDDNGRVRTLGRPEIIISAGFKVRGRSQGVFYGCFIGHILRCRAPARIGAAP